MSQLAELVATGPRVFDAIPTTKTQDVIYVKHIGLLEWIDASGNTPSAYRSPTQAEQAGRIAFFPRRTAPKGWLRANGAAVLVAVYETLTKDIYCGDAYNATAAWGYRCTSPTTPSTTRGVTGAYLVLPDLRGEFIRGWDDGRGVDVDRVFGSAQADEFKRHTHPYLSNAHANNVVGGPSPIGDGQTNNTTGATGGTETRPRNVALLACIKI